jgi:hypothetical protein
VVLNVSLSKLSFSNSKLKQQAIKQNAKIRKERRKKAHKTCLQKWVIYLAGNVNFFRANFNNPQSLGMLGFGKRQMMMNNYNGVGSGYGGGISGFINRLFFGY